MKITVKDIARLSGVSKGTVDRVLHNREGVSRKSFEKVMKVVRESGYEPNIYASLLAKHGKRILALLLPRSGNADYWTLVDAGADKAAAAASNFGVDVKKIVYDQYSLDAFRSACKEALNLNPAGVVLPPMFKEETKVFAGRLDELGIPYAFVDSRIEELNYMAFYGMPAFSAGYLCAALLTDNQNVSAVGAVRVRRDKEGLSDPTVTRRNGFIRYLDDNFPDKKKAAVFIDPSDPGSIEPALDGFFESNPDISHLVMFNSRLYLITDWLEKHPERKLRVVGFDNLEANVAALKKGLVTALITQRPEQQIAGAIDALVNLLVLGKEPQKRDNFMHMDILTRYNAD